MMKINIKIKKREKKRQMINNSVEIKIMNIHPL